MSQFYVKLAKMMQPYANHSATPVTRTRARAVAIARPLPRDDIHKFIKYSMLTVFIYLVMVTHGYAEPSDTPMSDVLCQVWAWIYGNMGRGLATIAVLTLGIGAVLGKTSWGLAITVGVGIAVIFNADSIISLLGLGAAQCEPT